MVRTQIYLTEKERTALAGLARKSGRRQSELIREAIDAFVARQDRTHLQEIVRRTAGIWKDRDDLPDFRQLRAEWDRRPHL